MDLFFSLLRDVALLNNILLLSFFFIFAILFFKESRDPKSPINWIDLLLDKVTGKVSLNKLGQFWGIAISSWVIIHMSQNVAAYSIFPMVFPAWLAYLAGSYVFNQYMKNKGGKQDDNNPPTSGK